MQDSKEIISRCIQALDNQFELLSQEQANEQICDCLELVQFFTKAFQMHSSQRRLFLRETAKYIQIERYEPKHIIFRQGERGDKFYIVLTGEVDIYFGKNTKQSVTALLDKVITIKKLEGFGEENLNSNKLNQSTARVSVNKVTLMSLTKQAFQMVMQMILKCSALQKLFPTRNLNSLTKITHSLELVTYPKNHYIYRQSNQVDAFYIIADGEVALEYQRVINKGLIKHPLNILSMNTPRMNQIAILTQGAIIGIEEFMNSTIWKHSAVCISQKVILYTLSQLKLQNIIRENNLHMQFQQQTQRQIHSLIQFSDIIPPLKTKTNNNVELRMLHQIDKLQDNPNTCRGFRNSKRVQLLRKSVHENTPKQQLMYKSIYQVIQYNGFNQKYKLFSMENIDQMVDRNSKLQNSNKEFVIKSNFQNPFFKDLEAKNIKQVLKLQRDYAKSRSPDLYNQQYDIKSIFHPNSIIKEKKHKVNDFKLDMNIINNINLQGTYEYPKSRTTHSSYQPSIRMNLQSKKLIYELISLKNKTRSTKQPHELKS